MGLTDAREVGSLAPSPGRIPISKVPRLAHVVPRLRTKWRIPPVRWWRREKFRGYHPIFQPLTSHRDANLTLELSETIHSEAKCYLPPRFPIRQGGMYISDTGLPRVRCICLLHLPFAS